MIRSSYYEYPRQQGAGGTNQEVPSNVCHVKRCCFINKSDYTVSYY